MAKRVSRSKRSAPKTSDLKKLAAAATKKPRTSSSFDYAAGTYTFRLMQGTLRDNGRYQFTLRFMADPYKGQVVTMSWNVSTDPVKFDPNLTNFDLMFFKLEDLRCVPKSFGTWDNVTEEIKKRRPYFTAILKRDDNEDTGRTYYDLRQIRPLTRNEVAALG